jgi:predicted RNA binding protein YcfA (HicA-like mRNA interferase family)
LGDKGTPRLKATEVTTILKRHGFVQVSQSGSHQKWRNSVSGKQVIVAQHTGKILPLGTMRAIITGSGIAIENWQK